MWWNPTGDTVAYLRSDEMDVKDYKLQYYNPSNDAAAVNPYPTELVMKCAIPFPLFDLAVNVRCRYPKPGTPNPLVTAFTFSVSDYLQSSSVVSAKKSLSWRGSMPEENRIIIEVAWVSDNSLLIKEVDRAARVGNVVLFQNGETSGTIVRKLGKEGEEGDDGWIDHVSPCS